MGRAMRHVPPGKGQPAPDPPNVWDLAAVEGKDWKLIQELLEETTEIAEVDYAWTYLRPRRNDIWGQLAKLGVTQGRMRRAYAINGKPITSHVAINNVLKKLGIKLQAERPNQSKEDE